MPETLGPFLTALLDRYPEWRPLPIVQRSGPGWRSKALIVPAPEGSDLSDDLDLDEVADEITISFDHCHVHMTWPPSSLHKTEPIRSDPMAMIDAILNERVVASSGWIDGSVRIGSIQAFDRTLDLILSKLQHIRVRSWLGHLNQDLDVQASA